MCINRHVSSCARKALVLPVRNVFFGFWVNVFFRKAKVYDVNDVLLLVSLPTDEKVLWLHVPIDEVFRMDILHAGNLGN